MATQRSSFPIDAGHGESVLVPDNVPFSRPRQSAQIHQYPHHHHRHHRETTQHPQQPLSGGPVAPRNLVLNPSRNIPAHPLHSGAVAHLPSQPDIDSTLSSLSSAEEAEDLSRIHRYRKTQPLFLNKRDVVSPFDNFIQDLTGHRLDENTGQARRKPEVAQRNRLAPSQVSSFEHSEMIRSRTATGEEVLISPEQPDGHGELYERPTSASSMTSFREFMSRDPVEPDKKKKDIVKTSRTSRIVVPSKIQSLFSRKPPTPGKEINGVGEEVEGSPGATEARRSSEESKRSVSSGTRSILPRRSPSLNLKLKEGEPLFQTVQRRAEERSTRSPSMKESRESLRDRPASAASIERRRTLVSPTAAYTTTTTTRHSRIPSSVSPSVSRPTSSHDHRRTFSTLSSTAERRPLRSTPSTNSLASSRTSDPSSPRGSQHSRSESNPNPTSHLEKHRAAKRLPVPNGQPASLNRSESAPNDYPQESSPISRTPSLKTEKSNEDGSEKALGDTTVEPGMADSAAQHSPSTRKNRADSMDSFLDRKAFLSKPASKSTLPDIPSSSLPPLNTDKSSGTAPERSRHREQVLRSPTLSDYDDFLEETRGNASPSPYGDRSPLYDRSTGKPKPFPKPPKSALEDDDEELDDLDELKQMDKEYQALLSPPKQEDEDDTFMLLGGTKQYEPQLGRPVRSKAEAMAGDRNRDREKTAHDKMMNRLKTLHMELRSARRGIDYIERRLNGVGSSDESEWVDDEEDSNGENIVKRMKAEETKQRQKLRGVELADVVKPHPVSAGPSTALKWGTVGCQLALIWFLLEIYFFYKSFPPSTSPSPEYSITVPAFGSQIFSVLTTNLLFVFRSVFLKAPQALCGVFMAFWNIILGLVDIFGDVSPRFGSSIGSEYNMGPSDVPPLGSDFVVGR
ncbi:hypothetical protein K440DRAFT_414666 [Wilcoxina mikolae CBS 423.85]|nr:hypothetical protein K440DRAFT_414666 [Wilcoxina mikolae CBS 423.85]